MSSPEAREVLSAKLRHLNGIKRYFRAQGHRSVRAWFTHGTVTSSGPPGTVAVYCTDCTTRWDVWPGDDLPKVMSCTMTSVARDRHARMR